MLVEGVLESASQNGGILLHSFEARRLRYVPWIWSTRIRHRRRPKVADSDDPPNAESLAEANVVYETLHDMGDETIAHVEPNLWYPRYGSSRADVPFARPTGFNTIERIQLVNERDNLGLDRVPGRVTREFDWDVGACAGAVAIANGRS